MKKKKVGKKPGNRRRQAPKDLTTAKSKDVTGGKASFTRSLHELRR